MKLRRRLFHPSPASAAYQSGRPAAVVEIAKAASGASEAIARFLAAFVVHAQAVEGAVRPPRPPLEHAHGMEVAVDLARLALNAAVVSNVLASVARLASIERDRALGEIGARPVHHAMVREVVALHDRREPQGTLCACGHRALQHGRAGVAEVEAFGCKECGCAGYTPRAAPPHGDETNSGAVVLN